MLRSSCRDILSGPRTARFSRALLQEGRAFGANMVPAYPGDKHACMSLIYAIPATGVSLAQMEGLVRQQLDSLAESGPTPAELERIKKVIAFGMPGLAAHCSFQWEAVSSMGPLPMTNGFAYVPSQ